MFTAICPNCNGSFPWYKVDKKIECPHCHTLLSAKKDKALIIGMILWFIPSTPIWIYIDNHILRLALDIGAAIIIMAWCLPRFAEIEIQNKN